jgi:hypothetical protein
MELGNAILATVSVHGSQNLSYVDATGRGSSNQVLGVGLGLDKLG